MLTLASRRHWVEVGGYEQYEGFRVPLTDLEIAKEADGRWRWQSGQ